LALPIPLLLFDQRSAAYLRLLRGAQARDRFPPMTARIGREYINLLRWLQRFGGFRAVAE
jgi:hypothetical protein